MFLKHYVHCTFTKSNFTIHRPVLLIIKNLSFHLDGFVYNIQVREKNLSLSSACCTLYSAYLFLIDFKKRRLSHLSNIHSHVCMWHVCVCNFLKNYISNVSQSCYTRSHIRSTQKLRMISCYYFITALMMDQLVTYNCTHDE